MLQRIEYRIYKICWYLDVYILALTSRENIDQWLSTKMGVVGGYEMSDLFLLDANIFLIF